MNDDTNTEFPEDFDESFHQELRDDMKQLASNNATPSRNAWEAIMEEMKSNNESSSKRMRVLSIACSVVVVIVVSAGLFAVFAPSSSSHKNVRTADKKTVDSVETSTTETTTTTTATTTVPEVTTSVPGTKKIPGTIFDEATFNDTTYVLSLVDVGSCNPVNCGGFTYDENGKETDNSTNDLIFVAFDKATGESIWQTDRINATGFTSEIQSAHFTTSQNEITGRGSVHAMPSAENNSRVFVYDANTKQWCFDACM